MYLRNLYPAPKQCREDESRRFVFGDSVTARVSGLTREKAERAAALWNRFSCTASKLTLLPEPDADGFRLTIGTVPSCECREGYRYSLQVQETGIAVVGADEAGLMDGIKTLVQLICPDVLEKGQESLYISAAEIHDAPAIGFRAVHFCVFPDSSLYNLEKAIHLAGFLKMTHVILEFWGTFPYECMPELAWQDHCFTKKELKPLVELARSYGMEVIPMSNHFGHAAQSRACYGRHVVLNRNPRLARLFEPDGWTWCLSNPDTYALLSEVRAELDWLLRVEDEACALTDRFRAGELPLRVTHNDTKINNVLFDTQTHKPLVVIDLDTVMPGLIGHDFGDAIRFAANFVEEDCPDASKAGVNLNIYWAFAEGFLKYTASTLTEAEVETLGTSCFALACELATRFLDDYILGDRYFKIKYPTHNLVRTRCQIALAKDMQRKMNAMNAIVLDCWRRNR